MSDLPMPVTREEEILYNWITGIGELPRPVTRVEAYLAYLAENGGGGSGGTTNYNLLNNKPKINGIELSGNKTLEQLGLLYTEDITTASTTWSIQHNLKTPWYALTINIIDSDSNIIYGDIDINSCTENLVVIKFNNAIKGKIIIKK